MSFLRKFLAPAFLLLAVVQPLRAEIAAANKAGGYTERQYSEDVLEFNLRTTVEEYKTVGNRDPKWDDAAIKFLESVSRYMSFGNLDYIYRSDDMPDRHDVEKLGQAAKNAGCDDPLVLDMLAMILHDFDAARETKQHYASTPLLRANIGKIQTSKYSPYRRANAIRRYLASEIATGAELDAEMRALYDADLETAVWLAKDGIDRRAVLKTISADAAKWKLAEVEGFCNDLKIKNAEPWFTATFSGNYEIRAAWDARGNDVAANVGAAAWAKFKAHLALAREHLLSAYKIEPRFPESATAMITVTMADAAGPDETTRTWFDRAVDAQLDYEPAYDSLVYSLLPRWGGTYDQIWQFAVECGDTKRFDTRLPMYFVTAMEAIRRDSGGDWSFWGRGNSGTASIILRGYAKAPRTAGKADYYYSLQAGLAWQGRDYGIGLSALEQMKGQMDGEAMDYTETIGPRIAAGIRALSSPIGPKLLLAEGMVARGDIDAGIEAYDAELKKIAPEDPRATWVRSRIQEFKWQKQFETGQWVDLLATGNMDGWYERYGTFAREARGIRGNSLPGGALLICGAKFGTKWELSCTVDTPPFSKTQPFHYGGGPAYGVLGWTRHYGVFVNSYNVERKNHQYTRLNEDGESISSIVKSQGESSTVSMTSYDEQIAGNVDGEPFVEYGRSYPNAEIPEARVGIGSDSPTGDESFLITAMKIRKLTAPPGPKGGL